MMTATLIFTMGKSLTLAVLGTYEKLSTHSLEAMEENPGSILSGHTESLGPQILWDCWLISRCSSIIWTIDFPCSHSFSRLLQVNTIVERLTVIVQHNLLKESA